MTDAGRIATLVEVSETLLLLLPGRRGGCTQEVLHGAPLCTALGHEPGFFVLQERRQGLSGRGAECERCVLSPLALVVESKGTKGAKAACC